MGGGRIGHELDEAAEFCRIIDWEGRRDLVVVYLGTIDATIEQLRLGEGRDIRFFPREETADLKITPFVREVLSCVLRGCGLTLN